VANEVKQPTTIISDNGICSGSQRIVRPSNTIN